MIRIYTDHALGRKLRRHRRDIAAQLADTIEALDYEVCTHNDRPSCAKCATRVAVREAAKVVRETGGVAL